MRTPEIFRPKVALPADHGAWAFFLSPLLIGLFAGGSWTIPSLYLVVAALGAFFLRQPMTILVKVVSRRRPRRDLPAAIFWTSIYGGIALANLLGLLLRGYEYVAALAIPGIAVFAWYLILVGRRGERGQIGLEILGAGVLALLAPAGYWIGLERFDPLGWWLWGLTWAQAAMSIVHVYARLGHRKPAAGAPRKARRLAGRSMALSTGVLLAVLVLSGADRLPSLLFVPFLLQWSEAAWALARPEAGTKPNVIGVRQLVVSALFTALFILVWS
jgi:hypothetical protein